MPRSAFRHLVLAPFLLAVPIHAQTDTPTARAADPGHGLERLALLAPAGDGDAQPQLRAIRVGDVELKPRVLQRGIPFLARKHVERAIREILSEEWRQRLVANGRDAADFEITDEEVQGRLDEKVEKFRRSNPKVDFWEAVRSVEGLDRDGYRAQTRRDILFDRVFMGGAPAEWPEVSREAVTAAGGDQGEQFWAQLAKQPAPLPAFWKQMVTQWIHKGIVKRAVVLYPDDGLPEQVVITVNGFEWPTHKAFERAAAGMSRADLELAVRELVIREALRQELVKRGVYLEGKEFAAAFERHGGDSPEPFSVAVIATAFKGFPTLEAYKQRWRLIASYERLITKEITDAKLKAHAERFHARIADQKVDVEVVACSTEAKARTALAALNGGAEWYTVRDEHGEFPIGDKHRGDMEDIAFRQVRQALGESEFTDLMVGHSLAARLITTARVDEILGPVRGARLFHVARLRKPVPGPRKVNLKEEAERDKVRHDYVMTRFLAWANDVVRRADIR